MDITTPFQKLFEVQEDLEKNREWNTKVTREINAALTRIFLVLFSGMNPHTKRLLAYSFAFSFSPPLIKPCPSIGPLDAAEIPSAARPRYLVTVDKAAEFEAPCELLAAKYQVVLERMQMWRPQDHLSEGPSGLCSGLFSKDVANLADKVPYLTYCYGRAAAEPATCKVSITAKQRWKQSFV